jgi:hypothetical protein
MLASVIEGLVTLGEQSQPGQFYPLVRELICTGTVLPLAALPLHADDREHRRGAARRQWEAAEEHCDGPVLPRPFHESARLTRRKPTPRPTTTLIGIGRCSTHRTAWG